MQAYSESTTCNQASAETRKSFSHLCRAVVQWHETRGGVGQYVEMRCGWGAHREGSALCIHLVINQPPLLQEGVDPNAQTQEL